MTAPEKHGSRWGLLGVIALLPALALFFYLLSPFVLLTGLRLGVIPDTVISSEVVATFYLPLGWYVNQNFPGSGWYVWALSLFGSP